MRDWLRRGDARAWTALAATAIGLSGLGDAGGAAALAAAVTGRATLQHPLVPDLEVRLAALGRTGPGYADSDGGRGAAERDDPAALEAAVQLAETRLDRLGILPGS
jgi:hypothetical protein